MRSISASWLVRSTGNLQQSTRRKISRAVRAGDTVAVRQALESGASASARDERGVFVLHAAARKGNVDVMRLLVETGADVDARTPYDGTALIAAVQAGHLEMARSLLEAGAEAGYEDPIAGTTLRVATDHRHHGLIDLLMRESPGADSSLLPLAALRGEAQLVRGLLARGVDPNWSNGLALSEAARGCHTEVMRTLLEQGARVVEHHPRGSALNTAAGLCDEGAVELLLAFAADPNARAIND